MSLEDTALDMELNAALLADSAANFGSALRDLNTEQAAGSPYQAHIYRQRARMGFSNIKQMTEQLQRHIAEIQEEMEGDQDA